MSNTSLKNFVDRIENLSTERDEITASMNEVYDEAAAAGFDKAVVKLTVKVRKDKEKFASQIQLLDIYMNRIGDQLSLFPVGKAHAA